MITKRKGIVGDTEINSRIYPDRYYRDGGYNGRKLSDTTLAMNHLCEEVYKTGDENEDVLSLSNYYLVRDNYNELYNKLNISNINLNDFDKSFLLWILNYMKKNLEEMSLVVCEIYNLIQNNEFNVLRRTVISENILPRCGVAKKLYDAYPFFKQFEMLNERGIKDFLENTEGYVFLLLYILKCSSNPSINTLEKFREEQIKYIDKTIDNLLILDKLSVRNIFLNVLETGFGISYFKLKYQPFGESYDISNGHTFYQEENIYFDGLFMKDYLENRNSVRVHIDFYNFVMKGIRKIDRYFEDDNGTDFLDSDKKIWDIYINSLDFDNSKLPSLDKLEITKSSLPSYLLLVYNKESDLLKKNLETIRSSLEAVNNKIDVLHELYPKVMNSAESLDAILGDLSHSDGALGISINNSFEKVKK